MLTINKTQQQKDLAKKKLQDTYNQHVSKVQARKHTLSQGGATLSMRTLGASDSQGSGIIKTVILPNEEVNRLAVEAEELRQYLQAQKQVYEDSVKAYEKDRLIREQEFEMKQQEFQETLAQLRVRLEQRQAHNYTLTKEFFNYKHLVGKTKQKL